MVHAAESAAVIARSNVHKKGKDVTTFFVNIHDRTPFVFSSSYTPIKSQSSNIISNAAPEYRPHRELMFRILGKLLHFPLDAASPEGLR